MSGTNLTLSNPASTLYALLRHPSGGRERLVAFQNDRLRRMVHHAYHTVAYYRALFDRQGVNPDDIRTVDDLVAIPISSRSDLQDVPVKDLIAPHANPTCLISRSSSGSSGKPFTVRRTWWEERLHGLLRLRAYRTWGLRAYDKHCIVMALRASQRHDHQIVQRTLAAFGIARQVVVDGLQPPADIVQALQQAKPTIVSGYPGVLARIAQTVNHDTLRSLRLRFVSTGGEVLTPLMRQHIQDGFAVPVYDTYASVEFNLLAWECSRTSEFHCSEDGMVLEVVRDGRPVNEGESGEVVGTDLHSFAMPLIRYRLGDLVTRGCSTCRCGQPFSTIRAVRGRMIDYFVLPGGKIVHPYEFGVIKASWIREFQVTQERVDSIVMRVVPFKTPSVQEMTALVRPIVRLIGPDVQFRVDLVSEIEIGVNGKFRVYRSLVSSTYDKHECLNQQ